MSTSGRSTLLLLGLLGIAAAGAAAAWMWTSRPEATPALADEGLPATEAPGGSTHTEHTEIEAAPVDSADRSSNAADRTGLAQGKRRFEGRGRIRGEVHGAPSIVFPKVWVLRVEPHPYLEGSARAETRELRFEEGERAFRLDDLPLGGYAVRAKAPGLNCVPIGVLLVKGSEDQFVTLMLLPSGFIDGSVLDAAGAPAAGLDITLESVETQQRATLSTDAAGVFVFRDVLDGEHRLYFGRPEAPLLPVESIAFKAPSLRFPTRTIPPTADLAIEVLDATLQPKPAVRISGSAPRASAVDVFSDHMGRASAKYLLPGRYLIDARSEDGMEASAAFDLSAGQEKEIQMVVRERQE